MHDRDTYFLSNPDDGQAFKAEQRHDSGRVSRDAAAGLDRRLHAVDEKIRQAMDVAWRRPEPSASPLLLQMREQVAEAEEKLSRAKAAGEAKRIREAESALAGKKQFLALAEGQK